MSADMKRALSAEEGAELTAFVSILVPQVAATMQGCEWHAAATLMERALAFGVHGRPAFTEEQRESMRHVLAILRAFNGCASALREAMHACKSPDCSMRTAKEKVTAKGGDA